MIVFSDSGVVEETFDGTDNGNAVDQLSDILQTVGWAYIGAVTGGHKLEFTSKQGLAARATLVAGEVGGVYDSAQLTVMSADETVVGSTFHLVMAPAQTFHVIANECQMFVWLPGYSDDAFDGNYVHNWACGIPYVIQTEVNEAPIDGECGVIDGGITTVDCWWSCGHPGVAPAETFRWTLTTDRQTNASSWNYSRASTLSDQAALRIYPTRHPQSTFTTHDFTRWVNGDPIYLDPYVGWGDHLGNPAKFRGQLYDAFLASCDQPLEDVVTTDEPKIGGGTAPVAWINYTHANGTLTEGNSYAGSLYLRSGVEVGTGARANYLYHG